MNELERVEKDRALYQTDRNGYWKTLRVRKRDAYDTVKEILLEDRERFLEDRQRLLQDKTVPYIQAGPLSLSCVVTIKTRR